MEVEDLKRIYDPSNLTRTRKDHVRWGAVLGLYTGARVGEIAQIYLRDFATVGGVDCFYIRTESDGQRAKTDDSRRIIPIHPDLIELGLLERVQRLRDQGEDRFFPGVKLDGKAGVGNALSKGFSYYIAGLGVKPRRATGTVGFHSLRDNLIQHMQGEASELGERRRAYVGHEPGKDVHETVYMRPWTVAEIQSVVVEGIKWREVLGLDIGALKTLLA